MIADDLTKRWRNKKGIADRYDVSLRTVGNWMLRGYLPYSRMGGVIRFDIVDCDAAMKAMEVKSVLLRDWDGKPR